MPYCRDCGTEISSSDHLYCGSCANDIVERSRSRIRDADEDDQRRMRNDRGYAHSWLQDLIGWIIGLMDLMSRIFSGGCYITSAAVEFRGLGDSSPEMQTLRRFRHEYIESSGIAERMVDLEEYYVIGAVLRNWINSRADRENIWAYVWDYVAEVISLAEAHSYAQAYALFRRRTLTLRFDVFGGLHSGCNHEDRKTEAQPEGPSYGSQARRT